MSHATRSRLRAVGVVVSSALVATGALVVLALPASAAARTFTPVFSANTTGDIVLRGNTLMTCADGSTVYGGTTTCAATQSGALQANNNYKMIYVDVDGDPATFSSSSATVTIPGGATVLYAGLSWGGNTAAGSTFGTTANNGVAAANAALKNVAKLKAPGAATYTSVTASQTDSGVGTAATQYQAYADVTAAVAAGGSGAYTVADVQAGTGGSSFAGWSLAVAYRDTTEPSRNLVAYSGFDSLSSGTGTSFVDLPVSGFTTPASGPVVTKLGVVAYEGDKGVVGDSLALGGSTLSNGLNPANDAMNSSLTDLNVPVPGRTPAYSNLLGFDIDRFDASGLLPNGSTSTTVRLATVGDGYNPGFLTFATDLDASALATTATATDVNGGALAPGDRLNYAFSVKNISADAAVAAVLTDAVPVGTTYVPGSLRIGGAGVSDASGDDAGDADGANVVARLGSGATSSAGGRLAGGATATVTFGVTVGSGLAHGTTIVNTAATSCNSEASGAGSDGASNTLTSTVVVPTLTFPAPSGGEVGVPYSVQLTRNGGTAPFTWSVVSGALPAGLTLSPTTGLLSGTPTAAGSSTFTVRLTDANGQTANRSATVVVAAALALTFPAPPAAVYGAAYNQQLTRSGGTAPYVWTVSAGSLPAGLTLNSGTGLLSGTPTAVGGTTSTITVTDALGGSASRALPLAVDRAGSTLSAAASAATTPFGTAVTLTATAGAGQTGTVTFTDQPPTGGPVTLGTAPLSGGVATLTLPLPAFGVNAVTALYTGDAIQAPVAATAVPVEVSGYLGEVIVREFRQSGPGGADDSYVELYNTGPAVPLAGFTLVSGTGTTTLPAGAGVLDTGRSHLVVGPAFSLGNIAHADTTAASLGSGGVKVLAPDTAATRTDAVGPADGPHRGTGIAPLTGTPTAQHAWYRTQLQGRPVDTGNNQADFALVSRSGGLIGGVQSMLGAPYPIGTTDPYQHNATLPSTLLDPGQAATAAPNRSYVVGSPGTLTVRRRITNDTGATVTAASVRVTSLSEAHGAPQPGVGTQPATRADLRAINPATAVSSVPVSGGTIRTVQNLGVSAPSGAVPGGGLNSVFVVPLPTGGLVAGASVDVSFTFAVDTRGTFWFGYDVDALTSGSEVGRSPAALRIKAPTSPGDAGRLGR